MPGAGSRRCRAGGGSGMAEVSGWRGRDHGGAGRMEAGWRRCRDGEGRITEPPGSQCRYRHPPARSPGSTAGTEMLQPAPNPGRRSRARNPPERCPAVPVLVPHGFGLALLRRHRRGSHGRVPGAGPAMAAVAPWGPCPQRHRPARLGRAPLPRGCPEGFRYRCTGAGCAGAAGAAAPVPGVAGTESLPQEPGSAVPGVPDARRAVAIPGVPGTGRA